MRTKIKEIKQATDQSRVGEEIVIKGWVRTVREQKAFAFVEVNDGSTLSSLQVILNPEVTGYKELLVDLTTGVAVEVKGVLAESPGKGQKLEVQAKEIKIIGKCDPESYPLQKKRHTFEFLRTIAHLRPRTNTIGAVARVRNALAFATHQYFQDRGFLYVHTPVITASDCEGAGELFRVSTMDPNAPPKKEDKTVDYEQDFFGRPTFLTVSGQLNAEIYACALSDVYTFGPTFRAENSNTARHLAEFWMIEPELAFADLNDDMDCAEGYIKYVTKHVMEHCAEDMRFFDKYIAEGLLDRLQQVVETPFERATYTFAIRILEKSGKKFKFPVKWGADLQTEHERYLAEEYFKKPVFITDYPDEIKPFYMRENSDNKTVAAMDLLVPKVGEIIGGSQREERLDVLEARLRKAGLPAEDYWWYLELRKYGSVPHAGFGVGFERMVQFTTGMDNIRDVIPFPRYPQKAEF